LPVGSHHPGRIGQGVEMEQTTHAEPDGGRRSPRKKRWSDYSPWQRAAIVVGAVAELIMTTIALRDLARRPATQVRGSKRMWVPVCFVQPIGPILYLRFGRR
jgi:hypothetical protein